MQIFIFITAGNITEERCLLPMVFIPKNLIDHNIAFRIILLVSEQSVSHLASFIRSTPLIVPDLEQLFIFGPTV